MTTITFTDTPRLNLQLSNGTDSSSSLVSFQKQDESLSLNQVSSQNSPRTCTASCSFANSVGEIISNCEPHELPRYVGHLAKVFATSVAHLQGTIQQEQEKVEALTQTIRALQLEVQQTTLAYDRCQRDLQQSHEVTEALRKSLAENTANLRKAEEEVRTNNQKLDALKAARDRAQAQADAEKSEVLKLKAQVATLQQNAQVVKVIPKQPTQDKEKGDEKFHAILQLALDTFRTFDPRVGDVDDID